MKDKGAKHRACVMYAALLPKRGKMNNDEYKDETENKGKIWDNRKDARTQECSVYNGLHNSCNEWATRYTVDVAS